MASIRSIVLMSAMLGGILPASVAFAETPVTDGTPTKADTATPSSGPATGGGDTPYLTNGKKPDAKPAPSAATPPANPQPAPSEAKAPEPVAKPDATPPKPAEAAKPPEPASPATPAAPATAATPQPQQTTPTAIQPQPEAATPNKAAETKPPEKPKPKPEAAKKKPKPAERQVSRERPAPPRVVRRDPDEDYWVDEGPIPPRPIGPPQRRRVIVENDDGDYVVVRRPRHCETRGFLFNQRTVCY